MRWAARLAIALALLAPAAGAQPVSVRSGEHDGFSRLVLRLPAPANWRFGRTAEGYELRIDRPDLRFDLSSVFAYIPRTRLAAIWPDPATGALNLVIRCACHAVAYAAQPSIVVIDIRPGPAPRGSGFEAALDDPAGGALPPLTARTVLRPRARPHAEPAVPVAAYDWRTLPADAGAGPRQPAADLAVPMVAETAALRDSILRQISNAAARGLVDPAGRLPPPPERRMPPTAMPEGAAPAPAPSGDNLRIRAEPGDRRGTLTADGRECLPDGMFAFLAAAPDGPVPPAGDPREPSGGLDRRTAQQRAEAFLALGFGAEARAVARSFGLDGPALDRIDALAAVFDDAPIPPDPPFAGMEVCDGAVALWAVMTGGPLRRGQPVARDAVARTFAALPIHLRRILGLPLAERFIAIDDIATARRIRDAIARAPGNHGAPLDMIDADVARATGDIAGAEEALRTIAAADGPLTGLALARLADSVIDRGGVLDPATMVEIAALARERRGTDEGRIIAAAHARALAAAGAHAAAFDVARPVGPQAEIAVWSLLATRGDDAAVLRFAAAPPPTLPIDRAIRIAMAERFVALALPEPATAWLGEPDGPDAALIAARAALLQRDGRGALRLAAGLQGAGAEAVRAEALALLGQTDAAAAAWLEAMQPERAAEVAWRSRDWALAQSLSAEGPLPEGAAALLPAPGTVTGPPDPPPPATLAAGRAILDEAAARRAAIAALLASVAPVGPDTR